MKNNVKVQSSTINKSVRTLIEALESILDINRSIRGSGVKDLSKGNFVIKSAVGVSAISEYAEQILAS